MLGDVGLFWRSSHEGIMDILGFGSRRRGIRSRFFYCSVHVGGAMSK